MKYRAPVLAPLAALVMLALGSCGGGGGGGAEEPAPPPPPEVGVFTGFKDSGNLNWESAGGDGGGVGDGGADGDGGVGAGGDFGQFRGANACVYLDNGSLLGCALTDNTKGMVTVKPGRDYRGGLRIELSGTPTATYYEEGRDLYVPFPADRKIRVWVPAIARNIGITPFTEAAYRMLTEGSAPESVGSATPTKQQVRAANERVRLALNEHFPSALHVDDIARLPFIKSQGLPAGSMRTDPRGRYGLVNGAFSKQASFHNGDTATPTLDAVRQLAEDLLDGRIDGRNGDQPAGLPGARTYDPNTLTGELTSALAEQAARFGAQEALDALPKVLNFGNVRYEGYLFDGSISKAGSANSTVAGWVAANTRNLVTGQQFDRLPGRRALALFSNNGHGGGFYKADANGPRHKVYAIGDNVNGELGLGTRVKTDGRAVEVTLPGAPSHIVGGFAHTLARMADGTVWAWGDNSFGQLGQNNAGLASSLTPLQVTLPVAAVAVAAANTTSYALGVDGKVYVWGANGGFGLLGNGSADGVAPGPVQVAGLTDIVQISARDNDVVALRRDHSVWHWGSHPADESAFEAGNPAAPYLGGTRTPQQINGLPAGVAVRKVLTEQGLFAALLANGHVYTWGVHFDITAGQVLRTSAQLNATRMLGLPPIRDMMPGGFQGYGARAFDRLTGMGVDYSGGMWKIRGRVGEFYEPDTEATRGAQRRPQGQGARIDCEACHTFLDQSLDEIKAASRQPTSGPACTPPPSVHQGITASLIHAETDCVQCHNPSRLSYPATTPSGTIPFAANGGWPDCVKPAGLPNRTSPPPTIISNSCAIPPNHVFTPPGTVCASCHNSVIARPLRELSTACAQPLSSELPTIATKAAISGAFTTTGASIPAGSTTSAARHELRGTLSAPLAAGQSLTIENNGTAVGNAVVSAGTWTFTLPGNAPDGSQAYRARVLAGAAFGAYSNVLGFVVDTVPPAALAVVTEFYDDVLLTVPIGQFATDTTPRINGTLSVAPATGDTVRVWRDGVFAGAAIAAGTAWTYTEPAALATGTYSYQADVADGAGNASTRSASAALIIIAPPPSAAITSANGDTGTIANGGTTSDNTPTLSGTVSAALPSGHSVKVFRGATPLPGTAGVTGTTWTYTDQGAADGAFIYLARVEAGAVVSAFSGGYAITVDTTRPGQVANVTQIADDFNGLLAPGATTADTTPIVNGTLSAALAAGERVQVLRTTAPAGLPTAVGFGTLTGAGLTWTYTEQAPVPIVPPATAATFTYTARVIDAANLLGDVGAGVGVTVNPGSVPITGALATVTAINGSGPAGGGLVAPNNDNTPTISGTIERALTPGEHLRIYRNTVTPVVPSSSAIAGTISQATLGAATTWSLTSSALADGTYHFNARVEQVANPTTVFGASASSLGTPIDTVPPTQAASVTATFTAAGTTATAAAGSFVTDDTTPRIDGTVTLPLSATERLHLFRSGTAGAIAQLNLGAANTWSYTDTVAAGNYTYSARVIDLAGNGGPTTGATLPVSVVTTMPTVSAMSASVSGAGSEGKPNGTPVGSGESIPDASPTFSVTVSSLPAGYVVALYRDGGAAPIASAATCGAPCTVSLTDPGTTETTHTYRARVVAGAVQGTLFPPTAYSLTIDLTRPTLPSITGFVNQRPYLNRWTDPPTADPAELQYFSGATVHDPDPRLEVAYNAGNSVTITEECTSGCVAGRPTLQTFNVTAGTASPWSRPYGTGIQTVAFLPSSGTNPGAYGAQGVRYRATSRDAAGWDSPRAEFTYTLDYADCSASRAYMKSASHGSFQNAAHTAWSSSGTASCGGGCHYATGSPPPTGFLLAPPIGATVRYYCRKP